MEQYQRNWKNYYEILQVSPNAEPEVITAAYRRLAQAYHPDTTKKATASSKMTDINEAYEVLSNPVRRSNYDHVFKAKYRVEEREAEAPTEEEVIVGLMRFAAQKAAEGKSRSQVADELTRNGVPFDVAAQIVSRVFKYRSGLKANWFQRHLHWTWVFAYLIWFYLNGSDVAFLQIIGAIFLLLVSGWVIKQKGRRLWWLLLTPLFSPLWLGNKKNHRKG